MQAYDKPYAVPFRIEDALYCPCNAVLKRVVALEI
jgi:hypothetical protein